MTNIINVFNQQKINYKMKYEHILIIKIIHKYNIILVTNLLPA